MQIISPMFSSDTSVLTQELYVCLASHQIDGDIILNLYSNGLNISGKQPKVMIFDFDIKYAFTNSPPSLIFEKQHQRIKYTLINQNDLQNLRAILKNKLNQRGFHQQFKPSKKIGKGNFASVYLAQKLQDGKNYAVKAFSKQAAYAEQKGKECIIKQIQIMRNIQSSQCMQLFEVFQSDNSLYIVVQLLEGGQLYEKIKFKYKFKAHQTKQIIYSILLGLKQMHAKKIMHRDLKPQNLLFRKSEGWDCVIADFGLAQFSKASQYLFVRCGTPGYVAPQVINIKNMKTKYQPICDMFSLGLIFHILLLGISAFPGKNYNDVLNQNRASNFNFQAEQYKKIQPNALNLLIQLLKKNPSERITAEQALNHEYFAVNQYEKLVEKQTLIIEPLNINCQSPLLTTDNINRKKQILKKDSCIDFKIGNQNIFTGKVQTVNDVGPTNNSVGKHFESIMIPKISKFSAKR